MKKILLIFLILFFMVSISFAGEKEELQLQRALLIEIIRRTTYEAELAKKQLQEIEVKIQAILQKEERQNSNKEKTK